MGDPAYEAWDAPSSEQKHDSGYEPWSSSPPEEPPSTLSKIGKSAAVAAGAAAGAWGLGRALKWAFPGLQATRKSLSSIDDALKKDFGGQGLKELFPEYTKLVRESGKPVTFADFVASRTQRAPHTMKTINTMLDEGRNPNAIVEGMTKRAEGQRGRVMDMLARELNIPPATLKQTQEEMEAAKRTRAGEAYGEAFKDKKPIRDARIFQLFEENEPVFRGALENAKEAFKYDPDKIVQTQTMPALASYRKDWWKFPHKAEDIPEWLHIGEPQNKLQTVLAPNIETLDRMKRALWALQQSRLKQGMGDVGAIAQARKSLTKLLDEIGPPEYKKARAQFAGDVALEEAADMGANLFKQNPEDFRRAFIGMGPDERAALARGFYGSLTNMNDPKFVREVLSNAPAYRRQKELLSSIFPDTQSLHGFLSALEGEQAMLSGERAFVKPGSPSAGNNPLVDNLRAITSGVTAGIPRASLFSTVHLPPYDPGSMVARRGSSMLFTPPSVSGAGMTHPYGESVAKHLRGWPKSYPWSEAYIPGATGALAGLAEYYNLGQPGGLSSVSEP